MLMAEILKEKEQQEKLVEEKNSGFPTQDLPWVKYYNEEELNVERPKRTIFQEVYDNNKDYEKTIALEFFGSKINYGKFFKNTINTAKSFQEYGVEKGKFVTLCAAGIPETAYSFYALSANGGISSMLPPHFTKEQIIKTINDTESELLIVMDLFYDRIKEAIKDTSIKNIVLLPTLNSSFLKYLKKGYKIEKNSGLITWNQFIKDGKNRKDFEVQEYVENMPVTMVYSSGTTSEPKGILLSNDSLQNSIQAYPASGVDISRGQKFYQLIPTWYSTGLSTSLHLPLSYGVTVYMDPRYEPSVFVKNVLKAKPNYTVAPTTMYEGFLREDALKEKDDLSYHNYPFQGGEALKPKKARKIEAVFKEHNNDAPLRVAYGQCECGGAVATQTQSMEHAEGSVGIPLPGVVVGIFDENFNELPYNERGLILADTPCSMIGYYKNPEANEEYFHKDENGTVWNVTGDVGHIDENGELFVHGRAKDCSTINDNKFYNFDIENIINMDEEIEDCDVFEKTNKNGEQTLVAHIILEANIKHSDDEMYDKFKEIQERVYEETKTIDMVPEFFKVRDKFPHAPSGKRDVISMQNETTGFVFLDKKELKNRKVKTKTL